MKIYHTKFRSKKHTYLNFAVIISMLFISASFIGCSDDDDDDWTKTNTDGRPSKISTDGKGSIFFYYKNSKLVKQKDPEKSISEYTYENNELTDRYSYQTDPNIMDGSSQSTFKKVGNIITVNSSGEPGGNFYLVKEIELGTNDLPSKITNKGLQYYEGSHIEPEQILYYSLFTYDTSGKILTKQEVYEVKTNKKVATYTYEYDNNKGIISQNGLPAWYNIYMSTNLGSFMYLCTTNNVSKINMDDSRYDSPIRTSTFTYEYNQAKYPVRISASIDGVSLKQSIYY